jgi:hypothetical protein
MNFYSIYFKFKEFVVNLWKAIAKQATAVIKFLANNRYWTIAISFIIFLAFAIWVGNSGGF